MTLKKIFSAIFFNTKKQIKQTNQILRFRIIISMLNKIKFILSNNKIKKN